MNGEVSHQMHLLMEKFEADDDLWVGIVAARDNTPCVRPHSILASSSPHPTSSSPNPHHC